MDGRKATGGKLEVRVKIREPLSGVDVHPVTEKWLVLDLVSSLSPPERQKERVSEFSVPPDLECGSLRGHRKNLQTHNKGSSQPGLHLRHCYLTFLTFHVKNCTILKTG